MIDRGVCSLTLRVHALISSNKIHPHHLIECLKVLVLSCWVSNYEQRQFWNVQVSFYRMLCRSAMLSFRMLFSLKLPPAVPCLTLLAWRIVSPSGGESGGDLNGPGSRWRRSTRPSTSAKRASSSCLLASSKASFRLMAFSRLIWKDEVIRTCGLNKLCIFWSYICN